jgi:hypothetical protein
MVETIATPDRILRHLSDERGCWVSRGGTKRLKALRKPRWPRVVAGSDRWHNPAESEGGRAPATRSDCEEKPFYPWGERARPRRSRRARSAPPPRIGGRHRSRGRRDRLGPRGTVGRAGAGCSPPPNAAGSPQWSPGSWTAVGGARWWKPTSLSSSTSPSTTPEGLRVSATLAQREMRSLALVNAATNVVSHQTLPTQSADPVRPRDLFVGWRARQERECGLLWPSAGCGLTLAEVVRPPDVEVVLAEEVYAAGRHVVRKAAIAERQHRGEALEASGRGSRPERRLLGSINHKSSLK